MDIALQFLKSTARAQRGFTVIEILVVAGIITVVSSLVFANNSRFGGQVLLRNLAYDIALSVRQAQVFGISVQRFDPTNTYAPAYGIHFSASSPTGYLLFADVLDPQNGTYECPDAGTANCELIQSTTIQSGYRVSTLCATPAGEAEVCDLDDLDISFQRPEPDAHIRANGDPALHESARIELVSPRGDLKSVRVEVNGQISVE